MSCWPRSRRTKSLGKPYKYFVVRWLLYQGSLPSKQATYFCAWFTDPSFGNEFLIRFSLKKTVCVFEFPKHVSWGFATILSVFQGRVTGEWNWKVLTAANVRKEHWQCLCFAERFSGLWPLSESSSLSWRCPPKEAASLHAPYWWIDKVTEWRLWGESNTSGEIVVTTAATTISVAADSNSLAFYIRYII